MKKGRICAQEIYTTIETSSGLSKIECTLRLSVLNGIVAPLDL